MNEKTPTKSKRSEIVVAINDWYERANVEMFKIVGYAVGFLTWLALVALGFHVGFFSGILMMVAGYWIARGVGLIAGLLWIVLVPLTVWAIYHFRP